MVCIYCKSETQVTNSRHQIRSGGIWRRRKCLSCGRIFTTAEQVDYEKTWVVLSLGAPKAPRPPKRPFVRDKLYISLYKSLAHRPKATSDAAALTATIIGNLQKITDDGSLTTTTIATLAHQALGHFDKAAATMYAAYHEDVV